MGEILNVILYILVEGGLLLNLQVREYDVSDKFILSIYRDNQLYTVI